MAKIHCPACNQALEHDRGHLPLHMTDVQRGQLVTGSKVCPASNTKVVTEKAEVKYTHQCPDCGMETSLKLTEDYPGAFKDGIKPWVEMNCIGCSVEHDGYYCSNEGCGVEVVERTDVFYRVSDIGGQRLPVFDADGKTRPRYRDFVDLADAQTFHDSLPSPVGGGGGYTVDSMQPGWYETPLKDGEPLGGTECRAMLANPQALLTGSGEHVGEFKAEFHKKVLVTDDHLIDEEPEAGEVVETKPEQAEAIMVCDCCHLGRPELPYHHDAHDDSTGTGRSWDYCQECEDAGCELIDCNVRTAQRRTHA